MFNSQEVIFLSILVYKFDSKLADTLCIFVYCLLLHKQSFRIIKKFFCLFVFLSMYISNDYEQRLEQSTLCNDNFKEPD